MKVLSLFDGIACGRVALERAKIPVEKYYSSEIEEFAINDEKPVSFQINLKKSAIYPIKNILANVPKPII